MNLIKKAALAMAALSCATTVAIAQEGGGIKIGARLGYSMQNPSDDLEAMAVLMTGGYAVPEVSAGMLGISGGIVINIPAGPVTIAPEIAFMYRNNFTVSLTPVMGGDKIEATQTDLAISIPLLVKYSFIEDAYAQAGVQIDIPIKAEVCSDETSDDPDFSKCEEMTGTKDKKGETSWKRASVDVGIVAGVGYMITPSFAVDFRTVIGMTTHSEMDMGLFGKVDAGSITSFGLGATYFF